MSKKGVSLALLIVFAITNIMLPSAFGISISESSPLLRVGLLDSPNEIAEGKMGTDGYTYYEVSQDNTTTDASAPNWAGSGGITKTGGLTFDAVRFAGTAPIETEVSSKTRINNTGEAGYYEIWSGTQHALTTASNQYSINDGVKTAYTRSTSAAAKPDGETWEPATQIWSKLGDRVYLKKGENTIELYGSGTTTNQNFRLDLFKMKLIEPETPTQSPSTTQSATPSSQASAPVSSSSPAPSDDIAQGKESTNGYIYYEVTEKNTTTDALRPTWSTSGGITKTGGLEFDATRYAGTAEAGKIASSVTRIYNTGKAGYYEIWSGTQHALTTTANQYSVNGGNKVDYTISKSGATKPDSETWEPATQIWSKLGDRVYLKNGENTIELYGSGTTINQNFRLDLFKVKFMEETLSVPRGLPGEDGKLYYKQNAGSVSGSSIITTGNGGLAYSNGATFDSDWRGTLDLSSAPAGENYIEMSLYVDTAGTYQIELGNMYALATPIHLSVNGGSSHTITPDQTIGKKERWDACGTFDLKQGENKIRLISDSNSGYLRADTIAIKEQEAPAPSTAPKTAQEAADRITLIYEPIRDTAKLTFPTVDSAYKVEIASANPTGIISTDGTITRPAEDTKVKVQLRVINKTDASDTALTKELDVLITKTYTPPTGGNLQQAYQDYELKSKGAFVHYVPYLTSGYDGTITDIDELANTFDAEQFANDMEAFGVEYVVFTAWHARMLPLYPSEVSKRWRDDRRLIKQNKTYSDRDLIGDLITELKKKNIDLHLYIHPTDGHDFRDNGPGDNLLQDQELTGFNDATGGYEIWNTYINELINEMCKRYASDIKGVWIDGVNNKIQYERLKTTIRSYNPNMIIIENTGGNRTHAFPTTGLGDFHCWEVNNVLVGAGGLGMATVNPDIKADDGKTWPGTLNQVAIVLGDGWWSKDTSSEYPPADNQNDSKYAAKDVFLYNVLMASVSKGGGLLYAIGCGNGNGSDYSGGDIWGGGKEGGGNMYATMVKTEALMEPIAESIKNVKPGTAYVTKPGTWLSQYDWGVSTESADGKYVYLHVVTPPANGKTLSIQNTADGTILSSENATLLNTGEPVTLVKTSTGYNITLGENANWDKLDTVFKVERQDGVPSPSPSPSATPSVSPSVSPSTEPSSSPSASPSTSPTSTPTFRPGESINPPYFPSATPKPTVSPVVSPEPSISPEPSVSPSAVPEESKFEDIENHWAKKEITALAADGIIKGITETEFAPERSVTRAEFAALIVRALKLDAADPTNDFGDVPSEEWYASDVATVFKAGIMNGDDLGNFRPNDEITREEMAKVLVNAYQLKNVAEQSKEDTAAEFEDGECISSWAKEYIDTAVQLSLISGYEDNTLRPQEFVTRAQAATIIYRLLYSQILISLVLKETHECYVAALADSYLNPYKDTFSSNRKRGTCWFRVLLTLFYLFIAWSIATATATVAPTIGLLPIPMKPIISTCAGTEDEPAN